MNPRTARLLEALRDNHYNISLLDQVDDDIQLILKKGWAQIWPTMGSVSVKVIGITAEGQKALLREEEINDFDRQAVLPLQYC